MKLRGLTVNTELENAGDWIEIPGKPGIIIKSRSISNPDYRNAKEQADRKLRREHGDDVPVEEREQVVGRCLARHCILDWEGVYYEDGTECECKPDVVEEALTDPENAPLRDACGYAAMEVARRAREQIEEDAGNSDAA